MKTLLLSLTAPALLLAAIPTAASAAPWQSINARQDRLYQRIDQGIRSGTLDRREAAQVKTQFRGLLNLESRYRRGGLTNWERSDLNRRYDMLSQRVRFEKHDRRGHRR